MKNNNKKIYVVGSEDGYASWLTPMGFGFTDNLESADLALGTGGADWGPNYYNEPKNPTTYTNPARDKYEWENFKKLIDFKIPILGICRSSQGGCILAGGRLTQNMRHPGSHFLKTFDGKEFIVSSSHHQCQFPFNLPDDDYKIIGWTNNLSPYHEDGNREEMNPPVEPDIVFYKKINFLSVQNHPEYLSLDSESTEYHQKLVQVLVDGKMEEFLNSDLAATV